MKEIIETIGRFVRRSYALLFSFAFFIFTGFAYLAPYEMAKGHSITAKILYRLFSCSCHQLPQRSFFFFGPRHVYPLTEKGYNWYAEWGTQNLLKLRHFIGNDGMGYKMAICQRDVGIYLSITLFCLLFFFAGNRITGISVRLWLIIGIIPMALDGCTQLIGLRESTFILRLITGSLFGFFTCWYLLPRLEASLQNGVSDDCQ